LAPEKALLLYRAGLAAAGAPLAAAIAAAALLAGAPAAALAALVPAAASALAPPSRGRLLSASYGALRLVCGRRSRKDATAEEMVVAVNALAIERRPPRPCGVPRVLLLLPHCLQVHTCPHRIVHDRSLCRNCGGCDAGPLLALDRPGLAVSIATGGTSARRALEEHRPDVVVAVACPRDLCSGILDAAPVPVLGILNERPCGDCLDTRVDVAEVGRALDRIAGWSR
jgi:hypothetical protein